MSDYSAPFGHFTLSRMFAVTAMACVLAASIVSPSPARFTLALLLICATAAVIGHRVSDAPISYAAMSGALAIALIVMGMWLHHAIGYFFYEGKRPYFEENWTTELIVFPIVFGFYGIVFGGLVGTLIGGAVALVLSLISPLLGFKTEVLHRDEERC